MKWIPSCFVLSQYAYQAHHTTIFSMTSKNFGFHRRFLMCTQGLTLSNTVLRSLYGLGCFICFTSNLLIGAKFNRPTVFTGWPLLTDKWSVSLQLIRRIMCHLHNPLPLCLHMGICSRELILIHYSCRCFLACWLRVAEKPSPTSLTHPFYSPLSQ